MKQFVKDTLVKLGFIKSDFYKRVKKGAEDLELAADTLEHLICSGRYYGHLMCIVAGKAEQQGDISHKAFIAVVDHIRERINTGTRSLLAVIKDNPKANPEIANMLHDYWYAIPGVLPSGSYDHATELACLEGRLFLTNWYWREIASMRRTARTYREDLKTINI